MEIVCYVILIVSKYIVVQVIKEIQNQIYVLECPCFYGGSVFLPTTGISNFLLRYSPFCTRQPHSYKVFSFFFLLWTLLYAAEHFSPNNILFSNNGVINIFVVFALCPTHMIQNFMYIFPMWISLCPDLVLAFYVQWQQILLRNTLRSLK